MKINIKNIIGEVIYSHDCENNTIKKTVEHAVKSKANLHGADLTDANLHGAILRGANLNGAKGNMKEICSLQLEKYKVSFTKDILQVGCQRHIHKEWNEFSDDDIRKMDGDKALDFWKKWKDFIFMAIELKYGEVK